MPLAKIHIVEGRYDEARIAKVSGAIQAALMNTLRVPPEDDHALRGSRREFLVWPGRGKARERRSAGMKIA